MTATAAILPRNRSNPGCMTVVTRDGSDATLGAIAALFPGLAGGGYANVLREAGGRDILYITVLHGGECGDDKDRWDAIVWSEGDRSNALDVVVERGRAYRLGGETGWAVRVSVTPRRGATSEHLFPVSFRTFRKLDTKAFIARALTAAVRQWREGWRKRMEHEADTTAEETRP